MSFLSRTRSGLILTAAGVALVAGCGSSSHSAPPPPANLGQPWAAGDLQWNGTSFVPAPACAWPTATNADTISGSSEFNNSNPDTASAYRIMFFTVQPGLRITLSGRYPDSRYMSLEVYDSKGETFSTNGVSSDLADYQIAPDHGSVNPWQHQARPGGRFTVTLRTDVAPGQVNTLPLAPAGTPAGSAGVIFFRSYLPAGGDPWSVPLPTVTFTLGGVSRQLPACPAGTSSVPADAAERATVTPAATPPVGDEGSQSSAAGVIVPFAWHHSAGPGRTPDVNQAYLFGGFLPPDNGDVIVVRAKAPTTPAGASPVPWPQPGTDMRYWSLCIDQYQGRQPVVVNHLPDGTVDLGCRADNQVALDGQGYYTFVIGTESQRATIDQVPDATFLPLSLADPAQAYVLSLRNMLPDSGFAQAIQNVTPGAGAASSAAILGPYYPRLAFCPLATLAHGGPDACFAHTSGA